MFTSLCVFEEGLQDVAVWQFKKEKKEEEKTGNQNSQEKKAEETHWNIPKAQRSCSHSETLTEGKRWGGEHTLLSRTHSLYCLSWDSEWPEEICGYLIYCCFFFIDILGPLYLFWLLLVTRAQILFIYFISNKTYFKNIGIWIYIFYNASLIVHTSTMCLVVGEERQQAAACLCDKNKTQANVPKYNESWSIKTVYKYWQNVLSGANTFNITRQTTKDKRGRTCTHLGSQSCVYKEVTHWCFLPHLQHLAFLVERQRICINSGFWKVKILAGVQVGILLTDQ